MNNTHVKTHIFRYSEQPQFEALISSLIEARGQFSVSPYPNDLKVQERTGWIVTYPSQDRVFAAVA